MTDLKQMAALTALNNMMVKGWFDICTIDAIGKMLEINPRGKTYDLLHTLHCIHFDKMPKELRDGIPDLINECLGVAPVYQFTNLDAKVIDISQPAKKGLFQLSFGGNKQ
jgi:hypothetical protein